jgi:sec-independent protein translocase protein TatB
MFEVGFSELLVIFVLALIVLGPEKLPRLAAQVGRWVGRARAMAKQFREQLEEEVNNAEANKWKPTPTQSTPPPGMSTPAEPSVTPGATVTPEPTVTPPPEFTGHPDAHASGPPPEPEAPAYEPPAYAAPSSTVPPPAVESQVSKPASHDTAAPPSHEPPARPGDVITTTHERGI